MLCGIYPRAPLAQKTGNFKLNFKLKILIYLKIRDFVNVSSTSLHSSVQSMHPLERKTFLIQLPKTLSLCNCHNLIYKSQIRIVPNHCPSSYEFPEYWTCPKFSCYSKPWNGRSHRDTNRRFCLQTQVCLSVAKRWFLYELRSCIMSRIGCKSFNLRILTSTSEVDIFTAGHKL